MKDLSCNIHYIALGSEYYLVEYCILMIISSIVCVKFLIAWLQLYLGVSDCEILRHHNSRAHIYHDCENYHDYHNALIQYKQAI